MRIAHIERRPAQAIFRQIAGCAEVGDLGMRVAKLKNLLALVGVLWLGGAFAAEQQNVVFTIYDREGRVIHESNRGQDGSSPDGAAEREIPELLFAPRAKYPKRLADLGMEGWVQIKFTIDEQGAVADPEVLQSAPRTYFVRAALQAIKRYRFSPPMLDGKPTALPDVTVRISFDPTGG